MIAFLRGTIRLKQPTRVVLEVSGVGFELTVPLSTSQLIGDAGALAELHVASVFTRQGLELYGFATADEQALFERLTSIRGIGPRSVLNLLSRFTPGEIAKILTERKHGTLQSVPGIGPKKATRILGEIAESSRPADTLDPTIEQAVNALSSLGLTKAEARRRLEAIPDRSRLSLNELLTWALRHYE